MVKIDNILNSDLDDSERNSYDNSGLEDETVVNSNDLLTVQEICELLKVSKTYIYWLTHQRKIPHIKMYGHLMFRRSAIDAWLKDQEVHSGNT